VGDKKEKISTIEQAWSYLEANLHKLVKYDWKILKSYMFVYMKAHGMRGSDNALSFKIQTALLPDGSPVWTPITEIEAE